MQSLEAAVGRARRILRIFKSNARHIFLKFELSALRQNLISMRRTGENSAQTVIGGAAHSRSPMRAAVRPGNTPFTISREWSAGYYRGRPKACPVPRVEHHLSFRLSGL